MGCKGKYAFWLEKENLLRVEQWARDGCTKEEIADLMDINPDTLYTWSNRFPEFAAALKNGKEVVDCRVEKAMLKNIFGYEYNEDTYERISADFQKQRHKGDVQITQKEWEFAQKYFNHRCCYCGEDISEIAKDKNKRVRATKDHIVALEKGGKMDKYNIVPCCQKCNSAKNKTKMETWYKKQSFFDQYKLMKIYDYVALMNDINAEETGELVLTKRVVKHVPGNPTLQMFWLRNRKSEMFNKPMPKYKDTAGDEEESNAGKVLLLASREKEPQVPKELLDKAMEQEKKMLEQRGE